MHPDAAAPPETAETPEAARHWAAVERAFLAHGASVPDHLARTLEAAPGFALAHAAQAMFLTLAGRPELRPAIDRALAAARGASAAGGADARGREALAAAEAFRAGRLREAAARFDAMLARRPGDGLALKMSQSLRFLLGDASAMRVSAEAAIGGFPEDHPHAGYARGCLAFALEETGAYAAAEATGRRGLELAPDDAWGLHAVAHVHDMTGRAEAGARWLAGREASWAHCANFGYHVWWHLALFRIDRGEFAAALALYDEKVRPEPTDEWRDIANAASLLVRLELEGVDAGSRWEELGALCAARTEDGCVIFADLHYLMALNASGREAEAARLATRIAADGQGFGHDMHEVAGLAGAPAARGLCAFRRGRWAEAFAALEAAAPQLSRVGGSHAQRDVFERLAIEAALRAGFCDAAEARLAARTARRGAEDGYAARRREAIAARRAEGVASRHAAQ